jgi:hypothetical protein
VDADAGAGKLRLYDGTMPAPSAGAAGTLCVEITLDDPAYGSPSAGAVTLNDLDPVNWIADGSVDYFRLVDNSGDLVLQGDVTVAAGTGTLKLSSITAVTGSPVDIQSLTLTLPNGV